MRSPVRVLTVALCGGVVLGVTPGVLAGSQQASPTAARVPLAAGMPPFAKGYELGLTSVVIPAGVALASHCHPGMQIATVTSGVLTMQVFKGVVPVYRGPADERRRVRTIRAGQTAEIRAGEWIVESTDDVHAGSNRGSHPVEILLASLFEKEAGAALAADDCG